MIYRRFHVALSFVILLTIVTGCSAKSPSSESKPAPLSKAEKDALTKKLGLTFIDRYPNDQGLVRVYGQLTNGTKRKLIRAVVTASSAPIKGRAVTYGTVTVEGVEPGATVDFEVPTGKDMGQMRSDVVLSVREAEFR